VKPSEGVLILALALSLLAAPFPSDAQQPGKVYRIGYLSSSALGHETNPQQCPIKGTPNWQALVGGLRERGYVQGQNLVIECRWTEGQEERAPALAAELVSLKPDLMVVAFTANVRAAKQATGTIPIVMTNVIDPVGRGLVPSLARPGGNVTGLALTAGMEMMGKYLQLLKEALPMASRVAVLTRGGLQPENRFRMELEAAAPALNVTLGFYRLGDPEDFESAFATVTKARAEALLVVPDPFATIHAQRIVDLATQRKLPVVSDRPFISAGGLLSYDVNQPDIWRRIGIYVDKIFKGANPGELPVEQPTKYELLINLKTAKALGLTIPQSLIMRAEEVIE
jgi:putative tryptophan/tyrosine transport system substrate-binding protein